MRTTTLVEHFFRHEYGRVVAILSKRVGVEHLEAVEDAVQSALMAALEVWTTRGAPDNPTAWLFQAARNNVIAALRTGSGRRRILEEFAADIPAPATEAPTYLLPGEVRDDVLRMLFVCSDETIPADSQLVLALKTLCGFSVSEIGLRLFTSEANVYKRLGRARARLKRQPKEFGDLTGAQCAARLAAVNRALYVLFTEGYLSSHAQVAIRLELCEEAIRLTTMLAGHPVGQTPETFALLALMHLHTARVTARQDAGGGLLLLEEQDRDLWDSERIRTGLDWLGRSSHGETFSRYHAEAGIAAAHCLAPSFAQTRWDRVVDCYRLLEDQAPSPIHRLNRAVAVAEWRGPAAGLAVLDGFAPPEWLERSYLWPAVLADLHRRDNNTADADRYRHRALSEAPTRAVRELLERRLGLPAPISSR